MRALIGAVAQLGERRVRIAKVEGSIPFRSTNSLALLCAIRGDRRYSDRRPVPILLIDRLVFVIARTASHVLERTVGRMADHSPPRIRLISARNGSGVSSFFFWKACHSACRDGS